MFEHQDLIKVANRTMPFGKYQGRILVDLPEDYLLWFARQGFPDTELGRLLALALEIRSNDLVYLVDPLRGRGSTGTLH